MSDIASEFERLLGQAALKLWPDLPRDVQELLFETAVPINPTIRNSLKRRSNQQYQKQSNPARSVQPCQ
jgi:hypothetical protein